jgi:hypothetical protein
VQKLSSAVATAVKTTSTALPDVAVPTAFGIFYIYGDGSWLAHMNSWCIIKVASPLLYHLFIYSRNENENYDSVRCS